MQEPGAPYKTRNPPPPSFSAISVNSPTFFLLTTTSSTDRGACFSIQSVAAEEASAADLPYTIVFLPDELPPFGFVFSPTVRFLDTAAILTKFTLEFYDFFALKELLARLPD